MEDLLRWCKERLGRCFNIRVAVLPASDTVRVWVQMRNQRGNTSLRRASGGKLVGEAPLVLMKESVVDALERAALNLFRSLQEEGEDSIALAQQIRGDLERDDHLPLFERE
ncbi:MAG: hypothetical protein SXV54_06575 [Chloroflexota bacterium]|nr:hypothetical protein [Chloroflexota bacterium]